ncbi:hypothetical protein K438DRAFT_1944867, partial [Mycena galopus ATCC 62051]
MCLNGKDGGNLMQGTLNGQQIQASNQLKVPTVKYNGAVSKWMSFVAVVLYSLKFICPEEILCSIPAASIALCDLVRTLVALVAIPTQCYHALLSLYGSYQALPRFIWQLPRLLIWGLAYRDTNPTVATECYLAKHATRLQVPQESVKLSSFSQVYMSLNPSNPLASRVRHVTRICEKECRGIRVGTVPEPVSFTVASLCLHSVPLVHVSVV